VVLEGSTVVSNEPMSGVLVRPVGAVSGTSAVMALFRSATPLTHGPWEAEQLWVARREQAPGAGVAKTRLAVKVAAWSTIPVSSYCMCLLKSVPLEQNRVIGDAQVDGLGRIQRANRDLRLPDRMTDAYTS